MLSTMSLASVSLLGSHFFQFKAGSSFPYAIFLSSSISQNFSRMSMLPLTMHFWFRKTFLLWKFFLRFFGCGPFLKSLLNLLQYCFCFMFGREAGGDLSSLTRDWTPTPALEGEVLTTGLPGKSLLLWKRLNILKTKEFSITNSHIPSFHFSTSIHGHSCLALPPCAFSPYLYTHWVILKQTPAYYYIHKYVSMYLQDKDCFKKHNHMHYHTWKDEHQSLSVSLVSIGHLVYIQNKNNFSCDENS